jgi:2-keto-4-pentenoate hydratase/2-oxohepta-3-ene-1,7-dioic acid hydratase in catechol pathway
LRLATVAVDGDVRLVAALDGGKDGLVDLQRGRPELPADIVGLLALGERGRELAEAAVADAAAVLDVADVTFRPVVPNPPKFFCVGRNYYEHVEEGRQDTPDVPVLFTRFASSLVGNREPIVRPRVSTQLDWEGELAIVIGKPGRHVAPDRALELVAGYTIFNDGSVRDYQARGVQWTAGKNFWRTGPFGPWLVTADEVPDPHALELRTFVNGEQVQGANTSQLIFDIPALIAHVSEWLPLEPGDVIATGTPSGVGLYSDPPRYLAAGDSVAVEIKGLGRLENPVVDEE